MTFQSVMHFSTFRFRLPVFFNGLLHRLQEFLIIERLGKEIDSTFFHGLDAHGDVAVAGDKDDRHAVIGLAELILQIHSAQSRHSHIENDTSDSVIMFARQEKLSGGKRLCVKPQRPQKPSTGSSARRDRRQSQKRSEQGPSVECRVA